MHLLRSGLAVSALCLAGALAPPAGATTLDVEPDGTAHYALAPFEPSSVFLGKQAADGAVGPLTTVAAGSSDKSFEDVQVAPSGVETVMWVERQYESGSTHTLKARRRAADGTLGETKVIAAGIESTYDDNPPRMATDPRGGVYFVWTREVGWRKTLVQGLRWAPDGTLSPVQDFGSGYYPMRHPQVAVDGAGNFTVAWEQTYPFVIKTRRRMANGTLRAIQPVAPAGGRPQRVRLAVAGDGTAVFSWVNAPASNETDPPPTYHARIRRPGGSFGPVLDISSPDHNGVTRLDHDAAIAPDGSTAVVTWVRDLYPHPSAAYARRISRSDALSPIAFLGPAGYGSRPRVEIDANGNAVLAWLAGGLRSRRLLRGGLLGTSQLIAGYGVSGTSWRTSPFDLDVDADGVATFLWEERPHNVSSFHTRRRTPAGALSPATRVDG